MFTMQMRRCSIYFGLHICMHVCVCVSFIDSFFYLSSFVNRQVMGIVFIFAMDALAGASLCSVHLSLSHPFALSICTIIRSLFSFPSNYCVLYQSHTTHPGAYNYFPDPRSSTNTSSNATQPMVAYADMTNGCWLVFAAAIVSSGLLWFFHSENKRMMVREEKR